MIADGRYLEMLWRRYRAAPDDVPADWRNAFAFIETIYGDPFSAAPIGQAAGENSGTEHHALVAYLRRFGHLHAVLDPLGLVEQIPLPDRFMSGAEDHSGLAALYCGTLSVETGHLDSSAMAQWVNINFEAAQRADVLPDVGVYDNLIRTEVFDQFLAKKYPAKKRFGSEGGDAILPLLHTIRTHAAQSGIDELVVGSMHRGRFSIMANFFGMDRGLLLRLMTGEHPFPSAADCAGDMPYHLGLQNDHDGMLSTLLPNPSHLEAVNPVAAGYARARRTMRPGKVLTLIIHTDASVIGQGVNAELAQMSALAGFEVGGTVHIVINNQIGFTTEPCEGRSSRYCTGLWRAVDSLIVHANGDDVDGVLRAGKLAVDFRNEFQRDAVVDIVCYRTNGHNEIDEPRFTQPAYYKAADAKQSVAAIYERRLIEAGLLTLEQAAARRGAAFAELVAASGADATKLTAVPVATHVQNMPKGALSVASLHKIVSKLSGVPAGRGNAKMIKLMERRADEVTSGITWALAEAMAFASVLSDGIPVRICGQDVERGPFSQRHLAAVDPEDSSRRYTLSSAAQHGATFEVVNSLLSEYAVLGFEYGYSLAMPRGLTVWESQFGDFANGAQIMIDQFITSGFEKWQQRSNLTVLLPHGLEGQGPEHSSARIERLVQLCARDNIRIAHPSTPANYFHLLRDQALRGDRPLFIITPKVLLRLPQAKSDIETFADPNIFEPVIRSVSATALRAIICSGKIAYELERELGSDRNNVAVIRLESLYPFPIEALTQTLRATGAREMLWLQEEPENFGLAQWLSPKLSAIAAATDITLLPSVARAESSSPAGSFHGNHDRDQHALLLTALGMPNDGE